MCIVGTKSKLIVLVFICGSLTFAPLVLAHLSPEQLCEARIHKIIGRHVACLSRAAATFARTEDSDRFNRSMDRCERNYERRYDKALDRWPGACPSLENSEEAAQERVTTSIDDFWTEVAAVVSGTPPTPMPGKAILFNNCTIPVKLMSSTNPSINGIVLKPLKKKVLDLKDDLNGGKANSFLAAPVTTPDQCNAVNCQDWTDILYSPLPPAPNEKQRTGSMYEGTNLTHGTYCQPTNAGAKQCTPGANTPCCGRNMNFDRTFGTQWEITPFGNGGNKDTIDLTTNYGTGPNSPPPLCPMGGGVDCVTASANIFYNVPIEIEMSGGACSCGALGSRDSIKCTEISCTDAFQHPMDNKNCSCSSGGQRGYAITYCPPGSPLPPLP